MSFKNVLLIVVLLVGYSYWSLAQPTNLVEIRCRSRKDDDINMCRYDYYLTNCKTFACWKGPGEVCSADFASMIGNCNPALTCCNGRCSGCLDGVCGPSCPPKNYHSYQHRSDPHMMDRHMNPLYRFFDYYSNE